MPSKIRTNDITTLFRVKEELFAGFVNYLTCAYITVINPMILSKAGIPETDVFLATCLTIGMVCFYVGFRTNLPVIIGPTSAINTYFIAGITGKLGLTWQQGLAVVFISGIIIFFLACVKFREKLNMAIPKAITDAITFGIGVFLIIISAGYSEIFKYNNNIDINMVNLITFSCAIIVSAIANKYKIPGGSSLGIILATLLYTVITKSYIPSVLSIPLGFKQSLFSFDLSGLIQAKVIAAIFAITIIVLLDSNASFNTLMRALNTKNENKFCSKPLEAVGFATAIGGIFGTSSSGVYLESLAGINAGGKTGLSTIFTGILFFLTLFFSPLVHIIPNPATAAILFMIAISIVRRISFLAKLNWDDLVPAILTVVTIPLQFSIADGIGVGIFSYTLIKILINKRSKINFYLLSMNILFIFFFWVKYAISVGLH